MYVNISSFKALYFSTKIIEDSIRDVIRPFFDLSYLFTELNFSIIYYSEKTIFLSLLQIEEVYKQILINTGVSLDIKNIEDYIEHPNNITSVSFQNSEEFRDWLNCFKKFQKLYVKEDNTYRKVKKSNIPLSINNIKIVSIDLELRYIGTTIYPLEIGISTFENGEINNYHYAVEERINKNNFDFGETKLFKEDQFEDIFESHIHNTDYIIGHGLNSEFDFITSHNKLSNVFNDKIILDTSLSALKEFNIKNLEPRFVENKYQISLKNALTAFDLKFENLHNAGNDSAYSLLLLQKMILLKTKSFNLAPNRKKKIIVK